MSSAVQATDIVVGATTVDGFNRADIGGDLTVSSISATNGSASLSCSSCFPQSVVGLSGWRITINSVDYTAASCLSRSAVTLTSVFTSSTSTYSGTLRKFVHLRVYLTGQAFTPSGETVPIQPGVIGSSNWYLRVAASVQTDGIQNILYAPAITIPATTNGSPATSRWSAALYTAAGAFIQNFPGCVDSWQLPSATTPTSWSAICTYNVPAPKPPDIPDRYYTQGEINAFLPSCSSGQGVYFSATGRPQACLTFGPSLFLSGGILNSFANSTIQEEGVDLTQRAKINFIGSGLTAADNGGTLVTDVTVDSDLNAIASNSTNGLYARTGSGTVAARTIQQPVAGITVTNGDGVAGDPTLALANDLAGLEGLSTTGLSARTATSTWTTRSLAQPSAGFTITNSDGVSGNPTFALSDDLAGLEGLSSTGLAVRSGTGTWVTRGLVAPAAGFTITNSDGVAGSPTFVLANDLAALEGLGSTGIAVRSATDTWVQRTIAGTAGQITVTDGNGVAANPTISLPTSVFIGTAGGSPSAGAITGPVATGTNTAGADFYHAGGAGTGTGIPGLLSAKYFLTTASGTGAQSLSNPYPFVTNMFQQYTDGTALTGTTTETSILGTGDGSTTLEAGLGRVGRVIQITGNGEFSTSGASSLTIRVKAGSTALLTLSVGTLGNVGTRRWDLDVQLQVRVVGSTGTLGAQGRFVFATSTGVSGINQISTGSATTTDFTATQALTVTAQWGTADASSITSKSFRYDFIR